MTIVVKKVPKFLRGFVKFIFKITECYRKNKRIAKCIVVFLFFSLLYKI